jgi:TilS substrate binding domain
LPVALQRRVLLLWLGPSGHPGFEDIERILSMARSSTRPARVNLPGGRHVARREKRLWLETGEPEARRAIS